MAENQPLINLEEKFFGFYFCIKNIRNNSRIKIFNIDYYYTQVIGCILSKFNEMDITKMKRDKFKSRKNTNEHSFILKEIEMSNMNYY